MTGEATAPAPALIVGRQLQASGGPPDVARRLQRRLAMSRNIAKLSGSLVTPSDQCRATSPATLEPPHQHSRTLWSMSRYVASDIGIHSPAESHPQLNVGDSRDVASDIATPSPAESHPQINVARCRWRHLDPGSRCRRRPRSMLHNVAGDIQNHVEDYSPIYLTMGRYSPKG